MFPYYDETEMQGGSFPDEGERREDAAVPDIFDRFDYDGLELEDRERM